MKKRMLGLASVIDFSRRFILGELGGWESSRALWKVGVMFKKGSGREQFWKKVGASLNSE